MENMQTSASRPKLFLNYCGYLVSSKVTEEQNWKYNIKPNVWDGKRSLTHLTCCQYLFLHLVFMTVILLSDSIWLLKMLTNQAVHQVCVYCYRFNPNINPNTALVLLLFEIDIWVLPCVAMSMCIVMKHLWTARFHHLAKENSAYYLEVHCVVVHKIQNLDSTAHGLQWMD